MRLGPVDHHCPPQPDEPLGPSNELFDDAGEFIGYRPAPEQAACGSCGRSWCFRCEPTPASLCPWCCGLGFSFAPMNHVDLDNIKEVEAWLQHAQKAVV